MNVIKSSRHQCNRIIKTLLSSKYCTTARSCSSEGSSVGVSFNDKGVATVTLQRPPANVMNLDLVNELIEAMSQIKKNKAKGMILTSNVPGIFSAGLDIREMYKPEQSRLEAYWTALQDMWLGLYGAPCTTVAAISGHSPGGGCLLACSCDYRVMVKGKSRIGFNETRIGLGIPSWFADTFRNILPQRKSEMALMAGYLFPVEEAFEVGLVDELAENHEEAVEKANAYISKFAKYNQTAMEVTKFMIRHDTITYLANHREEDLQSFTQYINSPEIQKGLEAYIQNLAKKN